MYCLREILHAVPITISEAPLRTQIEERLGRVIAFTNPVGDGFKLLLPSEVSSFEPIIRHSEDEAKPLVASLDGWARVYRLSGDLLHRFEVIAVGEHSDDTPPIYRVTFERPKISKRDHVRKYPAHLIDAWMSSPEELEFFLSDLVRIGNCDKPIRSDRVLHGRDSVAWIGPQYAGHIDFELELKVISEILGIWIRPFWSSQNPVDAYKTFKGSGISYTGIFIWRNMARKLSAIMEEDARRTGAALNVCEEDDPRAMLEELKMWLDLEVNPRSAETQLSKVTLKLEQTVNSYLAFMLHSMETHHKMAVCNHCSVEQVTCPIRGRNGDVAWATELLRANSEKYQESVASNAIFLRKERGTEVKYFVNKNALARVNELLRMAGFPETHTRPAP